MDIYYDEIKMTRRFKTLQKKLKELKAELHFVFSLPPGPGQNDDHDAPYHQLLSEEIRQRFLFIKHLLAAEIASHPSRLQHHHLSHIAKRLADLESAFREWEDPRRRSSSHDDGIRHFGDDAVSVCSCDDGEAHESDSVGEVGSSAYEEVQDGLDFARGLVDVNVEDEDAAGAGTGKKAAGVVANVKQREAGNIIRYCGAMMGGIIFGAAMTASIMLRFCGCCCVSVQEPFLFPT